MDIIEKLVDEAYAIFDKTSVFEVEGLEREAAIQYLREVYNNPPMADIERYLDIVYKFSAVTGGVHNQAVEHC